MIPKRPSRSLLAVAAAAALALALAPRAARAQSCNPAMPASGDTVICSGIIEDGFVTPGGVNNITVELLDGTQMRNNDGVDGIGDPTLSVNDGSTVTLRTSSAVGNGRTPTPDPNDMDPPPVADGIGILAGNGNTIVVEKGSNVLTGNGGTGISVGDGNAIILEAGDPVLRIPGGNVTADSSQGPATSISLGSNNTVTIGEGAVVGGQSLIVTVALSDTTIQAKAGASGNTIVNEGGITGLTPQFGGMGVGIDLSASGVAMPNTIENRITGLINMEDTVAILGGPGVDNVMNRGRIIGDVDLGDGDDTILNESVLAGEVQLGAGNDTFVQSTFFSIPNVDGGGNTDTLRLTGPDASLIAFGPAFVRNFETFEIQGGTWGLIGSDATLTSTTVTAGTVAPLGTVTLSGDYVQAAGSTFRVRLLGGNQSDRLALGGSATIQPGALLETEALGSVDENSLFTVLTAAGGVTGSFDLPTTQLTAVLTFGQIVQPNAILLGLARLPYSAPATTANQFATGAHLDAIRAAGATGDMATVLSAFDAFQTGPYQVALDLLHPEAYDAQTSGMIWRGRSFAEVALQRRPGCEPVAWPRDTRVVSRSACGESGWTPWLATWGEFFERDGGAGHIDFDSLGGDLALGADRRLGEDWLLTGYLGVGGSTIDVTTSGEAQLYSAEAGLAVAWSRWGLGLRGAAAYGHGWHHTRRDIFLTPSIARAARSTHESNRVTGTLEAGYSIPLGRFVVEPVASVDWTWIGQDALSEQGAASLDLQVDSRDDSVLSSTAGLRLSTEFMKYGYSVDWLEWADGVWRPELSARWREVWSGRERDIDGRLAGAPAGVGTFTVSGRDARRGAEVGARMMFQPYGWGAQVGLAYDGFYGDGTFNHFVGLEARVPLP